MSNVTWKEPIILGQDNTRCAIIRPDNAGDNLPVLYLLHGIRDDETAWWSNEKGQLREMLANINCPMLVVMPYCCGRAVGVEPDLQTFTERFAKIRELIAETYAPDTTRQGMLGISMGAKQALAILLTEQDLGGFSVLGLLSGKFQGPNLEQLKRFVSNWPNTLGSELDIYFHYCGYGKNVMRGGKKIRTGDRLFYPNNVKVSRELGGGKIRCKDNGLHNWNFWRPELAEFFRQVSTIWCPEIEGPEPKAKD